MQSLSGVEKEAKLELSRSVPVRHDAVVVSVCWLARAKQQRQRVLSYMVSQVKEDDS